MFMTQKVPSPLPLPSYSKHDTTTSIINSQSSKMGVQKETIREGSGAIPQNGQTVTIEYTGWLNDPNAPNKKGAQFDSSVGRGDFKTRIGVGQVIKGKAMRYLQRHRGYSNKGIIEADNSEQAGMRASSP
ncbi:FK506-binding protein 1 [Microdochium nivale]|nr:FK506-binding protein 1 [Microdochium nivale]